MLFMRRLLAMMLALCLFGHSQASYADVHMHDLDNPHDHDIEHVFGVGGQKLIVGSSAVAGHGHYHHELDSSHSTIEDGDIIASSSHDDDAPFGGEDPLHEHAVHAHGGF